LRLLKSVTEPESRGKKGPEPPPEAPPPAPPKHEISYIQATKEKPKKKKKRASTEEPEEEPEEAEQPKPKEEDEEDVEEAMLERLKKIGVEGSARLAWPVPAAAASLFHSMPAGLPDGVPVVRCHQP
jgi:outer membrane biosynthesis protein TonB